MVVSLVVQTGLIATELMIFLQEDHDRHWAMLKPHLERAVAFLVGTQQADGLWHDATWTGVTFPKLEYLIYPYIQESAEIQALGMFRRALDRHAGGPGATGEGVRE